MIYIPHPTFNFEKSLGGGCIGCINLNPNLRPLVRNLLRQYSFDVIKLKLNFDKYRTRYWRSRNSECCEFGFLREDGIELAIRVIANSQVDIVGYWQPFTTESPYSEGREFVDSLLKHIEFCCPVAE